MVVAVVVMVVVVVVRAAVEVGDGARRVVLAAHFVAVFARGGDEAHGWGIWRTLRRGSRPSRKS